MNIPKSCRRPVVSLLYATKFTAPNLCWACALASPVIFLTGDQVMQIGFGDLTFGFVRKRSGNEIILGPEYSFLPGLRSQLISVTYLR